jgi:hypothetical protein
VGISKGVSPLAIMLVLAGLTVPTTLLLGSGAGASEFGASHGKVHVLTYNPKVPPASAGCHGAKASPGGGEQLPLTVSSGGDGNVAATVNVCVDRRGPFPFILDSGAGITTINAGLASRLHLSTIGAAQANGAGCATKSSIVKIDSWSVDGLPLTSQVLTAEKIPGFGGKGQPVGLLGNDVLSRFGAVRINFDSHTLVLPGPEGAPLSTSTFTGPKGPVPTELTQGHGVVIPAQASIGLIDDYLKVSVTFGTQPANWFVVDTGTSRTTVDPALTKAASLATTNLADSGETACSTYTSPIVHSGSWSVPGLKLRPQLVDSDNVGVSSVGGILGADTLAHEKWVVLDYTDGLVVLG